MNKLLLAITSTLMLSCQPAYADTTVGLHLGSWHSQPGFNNFNPGVFVIHNGWTLGTYYNSNRKQSYYGGYTLQHKLNDSISLNLTVGAIKYTQWFPMAMPSVGIDNRLLGGTTYVGFIPKVKYTQSNVVHVMHAWRF